jgi:oligoribonuclease
MQSVDTPKNLLWLDLEMTGLEPTRDVILEVAVILTHFDLTEIAKYETGVKQDETIIRALVGEKDFFKTRPAETDALIQTSLNGKDQTVIENEIVNLINQYFVNEPVYLAGNSIHMDRAFIKQYWPKLQSRLHYRMLDVSSFKLWHLGNDREPFVKKEAHTALSDIQESIAELKSYTNINF